MLVFLHDVISWDVPVRRKQRVNPDIIYIYIYIYWYVIFIYICSRLFGYLEEMHVVPTWKNKYEILNYPDQEELLNKSSELVSKCQHVNKFLLSNYKSND